jgi:hypothetical protein
MVWRPEPTPEYVALLAEADRLRAQGNIGDAAGLLSATPGAPEAAGVASALGRLLLLTGDLLGAAEHAMAEEESGSGQERPLVDALKAYVPQALEFHGGLGTSIDDAVVLIGVEGNETVCGVHRFLECAFGPMDVGWRPLSVSLATNETRLYDIVQIELASGQRPVLFFHLPERNHAGPAEGMVLGRLVTEAGASDDAGATGEPEHETRGGMSFGAGMPGGLLPIVMVHLLQHQTQMLVAGDQGDGG